MVLRSQKILANCFPKIGMNVLSLLIKKCLQYFKGLPSQWLNELGFRQFKYLQIFWSVLYLFRIKNISVNESSAHTFHEVPFLNHSENKILAVLVWSSNCHDQTLRLLQAWATSEGGQRVYQRLIRDLRLPKTPAEIALILAALLSLIKLQSDEHTSFEENHFSNFLSLLRGSSSCSRQATLNDMIWWVRIVITSQVDATEGQKILRVLAHVVDPSEYVPRCIDKNPYFYWQRRFNPLRSHEEAL